MTSIPDIVIEKGKLKGKTVREALLLKQRKLTQILEAVEEIGGRSPHLEVELSEVGTTLRVLERMYAHDYQI